MFGFPWERSGSKLFLFWVKAGMRTNGMTLRKIIARCEQLYLICLTIVASMFLEVE